MKIRATIPDSWRDRFTPIAPTKRHRWEHTATPLLRLESLDSDPWGKEFKVILGCDFGETRGGNRYEKQGKILLLPTDSEAIPPGRLDLEPRKGKLFQFDRDGWIPRLIIKLPAEAYLTLWVCEMPTL